MTKLSLITSFRVLHCAIFDYAKEKKKIIFFVFKIHWIGSKMIDVNNAQKWQKKYFNAHILFVSIYFNGIIIIIHLDTFFVTK